MKHNQKIRDAVALQYDQNMDHAPRVVAKGKGDIAKNILSIAEENNVPIQEDPSLVEILGQLEINEAIPEELYQVVAEVFAFVYQLDKKASKIKNKD